MARPATRRFDTRLGYSDGITLKWEDAWNDGKNANIKALRSDPDKLCAGDTIYLRKPANAKPPIEPGYEWGEYTVGEEPSIESTAWKILPFLKKKYASATGVVYADDKNPTTFEALYNRPENVRFHDVHEPYRYGTKDKPPEVTPPDIRFKQLLPGEKLYVRLRKRPQSIRTPAPAVEAEKAPTTPATPRTLPAPTKPRKYREGIAHHHKPSGRWRDLPLMSKFGWDGFKEFVIRAGSSYQDVVELARDELPGDLPRWHVNWYLQAGGAEYDESKNIRWMLNPDVGDSGVRYAIAKHIKREKAKLNPSDRTVPVEFKLEQDDYSKEDFRLAFGAIDYLSAEADLDAGEITVWFQDCYEWHPVFAGFYDYQTGDSDRQYPLIHAAMVEMKLKGAADYWMKGEATVPLWWVMKALE